MDTPIDRPHRPWRRAALVAGALVLAGAALWWLAAGPALLAGQQTVPRERVAIAAAENGRFDDFIPLRGQAAPTSSVVLDAMEGGRVERKLVDDGALVSAGQPIAVLANSSLRLEVIRSEAEVASQLNTLRALEIQLERLRADNRRLLTEIDWQLARARQREARDTSLAQVGFVAPAALRELSDERAYLEERRRITLDAQRTDEALQAAQAAQLRTLARQLQDNLALARANLDALTVRAPVAGRLTGFEPVVGQSLARGQRLGQIDSLEAARVLAWVDEFHLPRVAVGQRAELEHEGARHALKLVRINPQVKNGQFEVELAFEQAPPATLRRGQTLQPRLALGAPAPALLLPVGAWLDGGGAHAFVVDGARAERRALTLGRRNVRHVEVLAGLRAGEQVIVSSYAGFADKQQLRLDGPPAAAPTSSSPQQP